MAVPGINCGICSIDISTENLGSTNCKHNFCVAEIHEKINNILLNIFNILL